MAGTPKFVFFDLGNVLLQFDHQVAWQQISQVSGVPQSVVQSLFEETDLQLQYERGTLSSEQFHAEFSARTKSQSDRAPFEHAMSDMFELNASMVPLVASLRASSWRLGILSNTCEAHWNYVRRRFRILNDLFQIHALSFELKRLKPEPEIYEQAAELAGVDPNEVFFMDDLADNVAAAQAAGFDAVQFRTPGELRRTFWQRGIAL